MFKLVSWATLISVSVLFMTLNTAFSCGVQFERIDWKVKLWETPRKTKGTLASNPRNWGMDEIPSKGTPPSEGLVEVKDGLSGEDKTNPPADETE